MNLPPRRAVRRQFWLCVLAGLTKEEAALAVGLAARSGYSRFHQAGGVAPSHLHTVVVLRAGRDLRWCRERSVDPCYRQGHWSLALDRPVGTEAKYATRPELRPGPKPGRPRIRSWDYRPSLAQKRADDMAARPKPAKLATQQRLQDEVQAQLNQKLSPEQVAAYLRQEFPDDPEMRVSPETIYQSLYVQGRGALRRELAACLRTGRALRKPRRKGTERRGRISGVVSISERPAEVEDRAVPGHWEGDLILGKNGRSAIGTLVERSSRFLILLHLAQDHSAAAVAEAMIAATQRLPQTLWKTLTWDQGAEMRNHARISVATDLDIYLCDPAKRLPPRLPGVRLRSDEHPTPQDTRLDDPRRGPHRLPPPPLH